MDESDLLGVHMSCVDLVVSCGDEMCESDSVDLDGVLVGWFSSVDDWSSNCDIADRFSQLLVIDSHFSMLQMDTSSLLTCEPSVKAGSSLM